MKERELSRSLKKSFHIIRQYLSQQELPREVKNAFKDIFNILEIEPDNDISNRREVYQSIAKFLQKNLPQPRSEPLRITEYLRITHIICEEFDERLLKEAGETNHNLLKAARELI